MHCREVRRDLPEYIEGELSQARQAEVCEHLASCYLCREQHDELEQLLALCRAASQHPCPENRFEELRASMNEDARQLSLRRHARRILFGHVVRRLAVAAMLVMTFSLLGHLAFHVERLGPPSWNEDFSDSGAYVERIRPTVFWPALDRRIQIERNLGAQSLEER